MSSATWEDTTRLEKDFLAIGLTGGKLWVKMSLGTKETVQHIMSNAPPLNDNVWHAVDLMRDGRVNSKTSLEYM